jgi:regulator of sigma E protease
MNDSPGFLWTVLFFILALAPLVFVHEMGHYLVGRWCGVKADVFSIGFGPKLFGWTDKRGTNWRVALFPLGGYVRFAGDMSPISEPNAEWMKLPQAERAVTFQAQSLWRRAAIVFAGPATNFLFAIIVLAGFAAAYGQSVTPTKIDVVVPGSPAAKAGLIQGDRILSINGRRVDTFNDVTAIVQDRPNAALSVEYQRGTHILRVKVLSGEHLERDRFGNEYRLGRIGVGVNSVKQVPVGLFEAPIVATKQTLSIVDRMIGGIVQIVTGRRPVTELGGPLKIAQISGQVATMGWQSFVQFLALISINLGFINLLPVPMLDGGHLAFYGLEAIRRKPASARLMEIAFQSGMLLVLGLMAFVTVNDLTTLGVWSRLTSLFG